MKQGFLLPVYNHGKPAGITVARLAQYGLPILVVDDGSDGETKARLAEIAVAFPSVALVTLPENGGKGAAVSAGIHKAWEMGITHLMQIDADGQHDLNQVPFFLNASSRQPEAAVCAAPVFDSSVPAGRKRGRIFANLWAKIVTLSPNIQDAMCGFRVYPVNAARNILLAETCGRRMGFDVAILVRLHWQGVPLLFYPVQVTYPAGNLSHFHLLRDNLGISIVFARLFFGMLRRLPTLLARKARQKTYSPHWSEQKEVIHGYGPLRLTLALCRRLPVICLRLLAFPVALFYYAFSTQARQESARFLRQAKIATGAKNLHPLRHILDFSLALVDKMEAWGNKTNVSRVMLCTADAHALRQNLENGTGALLICSHLGNMDALRGLAHSQHTGVSRDISVISIFDFAVTPQFNRMLQEWNPGAAMNVIQVQDMGPDTVLRLHDHIAGGGLVVIAGDRLAAGSRDRHFFLPFLGKNAPFGPGPFLLAALLQAPVYFVFALRQKSLLFPVYNVYAHKSPVSFHGSRKEQKMQTEILARHFVECLEQYTRIAPYQWYNFYPFWAADQTLTENKQ